MGTGALFANQSAIQVTGNNIANVNTIGYSRQKVRFEEYASLDYSPGQMGQGARAAEVYRMFDRFVEKNYLSRSSAESRWNEQLGLLESVETLFNESNSTGIGSSLSSFFDGWHTIATNGGSPSNRAALLAQAQTLAGMIKDTDNTMSSLQKQMDGLIQTNVERANKLMAEIAELNQQISLHYVQGQNNPNTLLDQRDTKVRELATIVDVDVIDRGGGDYVVNTKAGQTLVDGRVSFGFEFHGAQSQKFLTTQSSFAGDIQFKGSDEYEYTVEIAGAWDGTKVDTSATSGTVDSSGTNPPAAGTAMFRVSLDGGRTWLKDDAGNDMYFPATTENNAPYVKDLNISFALPQGATTAEKTLSVGDRFEIVPKSAVYWSSPTTGLINVTPQKFPDGTDNDRRLTGGKMAADFIFRDQQIGEYRERLNSFAKTLIWEVNRIHSQGVGLEKNSYILGENQVPRADQPLGGVTSGLTWADRLQAGNFSFAIYDAVTGEPALMAPGVQSGLSVNFDPATDSLDDVAQKINNVSFTLADGSTVHPITATVSDGRLQITCDPAYTFAFEADTTGLLAGLGVNTFFQGDSAQTIAVSSRIEANLNMINAGRVNGGAEGNSGDVQIATEIAALANKTLSIGSPGQAKTDQTLIGYYGLLVTRVGSDTQQAKLNYAFQGAMAQDLRDKQDENSGVNLDEEMTNLVKFQNSYKAAAKLITTADQMLQTLLELKQ